MEICIPVDYEMGNIWNGSLVLDGIQSRQCCPYQLESVMYKMKFIANKNEQGQKNISKIEIVGLQNVQWA